MSAKIIMFVPKANLDRKEPEPMKFDAFNHHRVDYTDLVQGSADPEKIEGEPKETA